MIEVIVINRRQDVDRLAFMTSQLDDLHLRFMRLEAFTPETMPDGIDPDYWERWQRPMSDGEKACFLSHRAAWEWVAEHGPALILEDDAALATQVPDLLRNLETTSGIEHLSLEVRARHKLLSKTSIPVAHGVTGHRLYLDRTGAAAYVLWPEGARKLLHRAKRAPAIADGMICQAYNLRSFQTCPAMAMQLDMLETYGIESGIETTSNTRGKRKKRKSLRQTVRRLAAQLGMLIRRIRYAPVAKKRFVPVRAEFFDF